MHPATRKKGGRIYRMKKISVRFEKEPARDDIEIIIRADSRDGQVNALIEAADRGAFERSIPACVAV